MPQERKPTRWTRDVLEKVRSLASAGVHEASTTILFQHVKHVTIRVDGLDGVGVIHQRDPSGPFNLCVFEPSTREKHGYAEIFERTMASLDELPQRVEEWRSFRSNDLDSTGLVKRRKWLQEVATFKRSSLDNLRESYRLRAMGDLKGAWQAAGFDIRFDRRLLDDTPSLARERLLQDFDSVAPDLLAWHLPCDEKGKLLLKRRLPLFRYDRDKRRMKDFCLVVATPDKRAGRPEILAEWVQADLHTARLDMVPEYFDVRVEQDFAPVLLGVERRKARSVWSARSTAPAAKILRLQYQGQFLEAGKRAGVELDEVILECLQARRVAHMCTCCAPLDRQLIEWSGAARAALMELNFTRIAAVTLRDQERRSGKPRAEPLPLFPFPLQHHARKAHLALDVRNREQPRLTIDVTGSGNRVPIAVWKRPVEIDLLLEKLITPEELPQSVARQLGLEDAAG